MRGIVASQGSPRSRWYAESAPTCAARALACRAPELVHCEGLDMEQKYLLIVARRARSTYALMRDTCASHDDIDVVLDRRHGQRRRSSVPTQANRRGRDRRSHTIEVFLRQLGWVLVERRADAES